MDNAYYPRTCRVTAGARERMIIPCSRHIGTSSGCSFPRTLIRPCLPARPQGHRFASPARHRRAPPGRIDPGVQVGLPHPALEPPSRWDVRHEDSFSGDGLGVGEKRKPPRATVWRCSCGEPGCASISVRVRREKGSLSGYDAVIWDDWSLAWGGVEGLAAPPPLRGSTASSSGSPTRIPPPGASARPCTGSDPNLSGHRRVVPATYGSPVAVRGVGPRVLSGVIVRRESSRAVVVPWCSRRNRCCPWAFVGVGLAASVDGRVRRSRCP